jgi:hypothetical protein
MSFPSVAIIARSMGINPASATPAQAEDLLLAAVRQDCGEAVDYLHKLSHEAQQNPDGVVWTEDPNSPLGKTLIRLHASDAVRRLLEKHVCHGQKLHFANCCGGIVGGGGKMDEPGADALFQIQSQAGPVAFADC